LSKRNISQLILPTKGCFGASESKAFHPFSPSGIDRKLSFVNKSYVNDVKKRKILSEVALGNVPPDTAIANGSVFNAFTGEISDIGSH